MSHTRAVSTWLFVSVLLAAMLGAMAVVVARKHRGENQQQSIQLGSGNTPRPTAGSRFRNLSLHPEAGKLSRKLGQRFIDSDSAVSVLVGEVVTGDIRVPVRVVRRQDRSGESVEIAANGKTLSWNASDRAKRNAALPDFDRTLIDRVVFDSPDAFILAQLKGASYHVLARNVRADIGGADNYDGPLWTVVRVSYPAAGADTEPQRIYYINSGTGLIDKVVSEQSGQEIEATFDRWTTEKGETFPAVVRWTRDGQQLMEFRVINFGRSNVR